MAPTWTAHSTEPDAVHERLADVWDEFDKQLLRLRQIVYEIKAQNERMRERLEAHEHNT